MKKRNILILSCNELKERGFILPPVISSPLGQLYHIDDFSKENKDIVKFMDLNDSPYLLISCEDMIQKRELVINFTLNDATELMSEAQKSEQRDINQDFDTWIFKASDGIDMNIKITTGKDCE